MPVCNICFYRSSCKFVGNTGEFRGTKWSAKNFKQLQYCFHTEREIYSSFPDSVMKCFAFAAA